MKHFLFLLLLLNIWLVGCATDAGPPTSVVPLPETVMITNEAGETIATQTGPLWVLLSGVDEHGLIAEHELTLLAEADALSDAKSTIHTGVAVAVQEIRHTGPQNLQRFYHIQTLDGHNGWISDYYVRRVGYLFNDSGTEVSLYAAPGENEVAQLPNITPIAIKDPTRTDWWIVQTVDSELTGWVEAGYVKESSEPEFLLNQQHPHP
jgi:hypothetical protein